jgi:hypothetical protein
MLDTVDTSACFEPLAALSGKVFMSVSVHP